MIKRIEKWLAGIIKAELRTVESDASGLYEHLTSEITVLRKDVHEAIAALHTASDERASKLKSHVEEVAAQLHTDVAADAKAIALFRQTVRMPCSMCGQMSWDYGVRKDAGKTICADCKKKGLE